MADDIFGEIYKEMGAKPIINAIGSVTLLGGSTPKPVVKEAMDRADAAYVHLPHLQEVVGKKIAENTIVQDVKHGVLIVRVDSPIWAQELQFQKKEVLLKINKTLGKKTIKDIRFV